jgi:3',5'-cyclic AMP phosphodiesterase CpdA
MQPLLLRKTLVTLLLSASATLAMADKAPLDQNLVALCADPHATADPKLTDQRAGLTQTVHDILACNPQPAHVLIYGDLAYHHGEPTDYLELKQWLKPLEDAGIHWDACPGNHDRREPFLKAFPDRLTNKPLVPGRLVTVVRTPHADFILLDSCLEDSIPGGIDEPQRAWLEQTLAAPGKPVFVGAHHPLGETGVTAVLRSHPLCKGYIFGHVHTWTQQAHDGIETLGLPSTGQGGDIGYVLVKLSADKAVFTLHQHDYYPTQPAGGPRKTEPEWQRRTEQNQGLEWHVSLDQRPNTGNNTKNAILVNPER